MTPTLLRYGAIAAIVLSLLMFGPYALTGPRPDLMDIGELIGYSSMVLCLTATWFAMRRERRRRGELRYAQAFAIGVGVSAVASVLFGVATYAFYSVAGDALPEAIFAFYMQNARDAGGPDVAGRVAELERMRPMFFNRPLQSAVMLATVFVIGVVESLIGAWFARSPRPA